MRICLVASPGGHLTQLLYLREALAGHDFFFITYSEKRTLAQPKTYLLRNIWRNPFAFLYMLPKVLMVLIREKPGLVVSTGGEIAVPVFLLGRLLGIRTMFIESLGRVGSRSATGFLLYPISSVFLVQWRDSLKFYGRRAAYWGSLL
jgi:beta-1,4-N-acetylglucosaminyltransferase